MSVVPQEPGTDLVPQHAEGGELSTSMQQAMARHEIEGAIVVARRFPRNEDAAYGRVMKSCQRWNFASIARYSYPRGGQQIEGPSVNLAREVARCWTNIRYGCDIVHDDDASRTVRGWAWDVESNTKESQDSTFKKLIYRKKGGWQSPDERDLRELTNKHGAICVRNCLLHLVPPDLIEEAIRCSKATLEHEAAKDPDEARKKMIRAFAGLGVTVEDLELYLGHPLKQASPGEISDLRGIWKSISDGNSVWAEYVKAREPAQSEKKNGGATIDDLTKAPAPKPSPESQEDRTPEAPDEDAVWWAEFMEELQPLTAITAVNQLQEVVVKGGAKELLKKKAVEACLAHCEKIRSSRGGRGKGQMFDTAAESGG